MAKRVRPKAKLPAKTPISVLGSIPSPVRYPAFSDQPFTESWKSSNLVLVVEGRKFHVHRDMLIVCSPVFEAMLTSNFKEKDALEIPLPGKKADDIEQLLNAIYPDRESEITKENCFILLKLSTEYQICRLKAHCENFVIDWTGHDMTQDEAIELIVLSQNFPLNDKTVQGCMKRFVSDQHHTWDKLKKHKLFSELEPANVQRITEERVKYLEKPSNKNIETCPKLKIRRPPLSSSSSSDSESETIRA